MARERKKPGKVAENKSDTIREIPLACSDEATAVAFFEKKRWGDNPTCPCCGSENVYKQTDSKTGEREKHFRWRCKGCKAQYSVRKNSVLEETRIPLRHWCYAMWAACASKKGVSAKQIERMTGLSYKSALFLMHRIRHAMTDFRAPDPIKLAGTIEVDETWVGGKPRFKANGQWYKEVRDKWSSKTPVVAFLQRDGDMRAEAYPSLTGDRLRAAFEQHVERGSTIVTDEHLRYRKLGPEWGTHKHTYHRNKQYVDPTDPENHINTAESFFALFKRGVHGTFHSISPKHMHRYAHEFEYRWNTRKVDDGERFDRLVKQMVGKRLRYREPVSKAS